MIFFQTKIFFWIEKLQEKRDEEEQQTIPSNSDLHVYDDQMAISLEPKEKRFEVKSFSRRRWLFSSISFRVWDENLSFVRVMRRSIIWEN